MSVFTRRLGAIQPTAPGSTLIYAHTSPIPGVLRDLVLGNFSGAPQVMDVFLVTPGSTVRLLQALVETDRTEHLDLRVGLEPGDELYLQANTTFCSATATGYVFAS